MYVRIRADIGGEEKGSFALIFDLLMSPFGISNPCGIFFFGAGYASSGYKFDSGGFRVAL